MFMKIVKKTGLLGLGVAAGVIFMIGMILPGEVWAASGLVAEKGSGGTMLAEGCFFDEGIGKLTITEEFGWNRVIMPSKDMSWEYIEGLIPEEVITAEIDLAGTNIFLENEGEYEKEFGHHICFRDFINLETIFFTGSMDTRLKVDLCDMFCGCSKLKNCDFSGFSGANVIDMWSMFEGCSALTSLDLKVFNTSNVSYMKFMFSGCGKLTSLDLSSFNTLNVQNMDSMFEGCSSLTNLDLSSFDTSNVQNMGSMFSGCSLLRSLDLKNFNTSNAQDMADMFSSCSALTSLDLSSFDTSKVQFMDSMFGGCSLLFNLNLSSFDTSKVQSMMSMFGSCSSLESLNLNNFDTSNVQNMCLMFDGCSSLISLDLTEFNTSKLMDMSFMFRGCSSLTSLDLKSFDTSNVTTMDSMFKDCSSLTSLNLSDFDTSNVQNMRFMFDRCDLLASLYLNNFDTSNVTTMCAMFQRCYNLQTIDVHNFKTLNVTDISAMFNLCDSLREIDISNFDFGKIESKNGNNIFANMDSVEKIKVPANLPYALQLPYSFTIPNNMESYWVNTSGKECSEIQAGLSVPMTYSRRLRTVTNPSAKHLAKGKTFTDLKTNCKFKVTSFPAENPTVAFTGVTKKSKKVTIPSVVTYQGVTCQVTSVSAKALKGNTKIKSLIIGSNITRIEKKAFEGCKNLKKITVETEKLNFVGKNALKRMHKKCRIKVPSSNLKSYQKLFRKKGQKSTVKITK